MTPSLGIEPGPHCWEARALTAVPPLRSDVQKCFNDKLLPLPPSPFPTPKKEPWIYLWVYQAKVLFWPLARFVLE